MAAFQYRTLTAEHAEDWQALRRAGARDFPLGFLLTEAEVASADHTRCMRILEGGTFRGVFHGAQLVGFCGVRLMQPERIRHRVEIGPFFVAAERHGTGAAQAMMAGVIAEARSSGRERIMLTVDSENARAIAFYRRQGFVTYAEIHDAVRVDGVPRTDLCMVLDLRG